MISMDDFAELRRRLVDNQIRPSEITDHDLIQAFLAVPRELFVAPGERPFAYSDRELRYSDKIPNRRLIDPVQQARLIAALPIGPDSKVMVIGCGTGYSAAILARLAGTVVALEEEPELAARAAELLPQVGAGNVDLVQGKLSEGWPAEAPYDAILFDGAVEVVPEPILAQLRPDAVLVAIVASERISRAMMFERVAGRASEWPLFEAWATLLPGFERAREFVF
jgi:protein-L-isoaspartate(D-aspartate) O-methyltransferase